MHAIAAMVETLRADPGTTGLVWANGGYLTKHAFGIYSTEPPAGGFRHAHPQDEIDVLPSREVVAAHAGEATIQTWTVMPGKDGQARTDERRQGQERVSTRRHRLVPKMYTKQK